MDTHSNIRGRRLSCTGARLYDERDVDSLVIQFFLPNFCLHCINLFYRDKLIKHYSLRNFFQKKDDLGKCVVLVDLFSDLFFCNFGVLGKIFDRGHRVSSKINDDELGSIC